jgi:tripartite ATP-independent transporter DctP family solute receptor
MKKLNGFGLDNTPRGIATKAFIDYVEKESKGRIKIDTFPNETYGTEHEMIEAVQNGTLDMQIVGANMLANTVPQFAALSLPFLIQNIDEGHAVLDGPVGNRLKELGEGNGFKVIGDVALGYAQVTNNIRPINNPEDFTGVKMRSPNDITFIETFKAFGASVSAMGYTEIYTGLVQGVIDGQFNPLSNIFDLNLDAVQDYLAMTNHAFYVAFIIMNKDVFDYLDPGLQQIVLEAGNKGRDAARKYVGNKEEELREKAKTAFKEITYPEMKPFREAVQPVYAKMEEDMGAEIINNIQEFLKDYRSIIKQNV